MYVVKLLILNAVSVNLHEFGLVKIFFVINSSFCRFELQPYTTVCFDRHNMAYKTEIPNMAQANEFISSGQLWTIPRIIATLIRM